MSVLMDKEGHESGDIIYRRDLKVGYLEQSPQFDPEESVLQACFNHEDDGEGAEGETDSHTAAHYQPGTADGTAQRRTAEASGAGECADYGTRLPDAGRADQPPGPGDDRVAGRLSEPRQQDHLHGYARPILPGQGVQYDSELDDRTIYTYRGNYAYYLEKRQERMDNLRAEIQHSKNLYRRELDWMRRQPQARGHKAKYREDAFYELEKVAKQRIEDRQVRLKASGFI